MVSRERRGVGSFLVCAAYPSTLTAHSITDKERPIMPKYVIEREVPEAGKLPTEALQAMSQKSCAVLSGMGPQIQWVQSYVTDDKIYCVYIAPNEEVVREHAAQGGFPANRISEIRTVIDPATAEQQ
jgi:hypothetical protein